MKGLLGNFVNKRLIIHQFLPQLLIYLTHLAVIYFNGFSFSGDFVFNYALISIFALLIGFRSDVNVISSPEANIDNNFNIGLFSVIIIGGLFLILSVVFVLLFEIAAKFTTHYIILSSISLAFIELYSSLLLRLGRILGSLLVKILPIFFFNLLITNNITAINLLTYSFLLSSGFVIIIDFTTCHQIRRFQFNVPYWPSVFFRNASSTVMSFLRLSNANLFNVFISLFYGSYQLGVLSNIVRSASIFLIPLSAFLQTTMLLKMSESSCNHSLKIIWIQFFKYVILIGVISGLFAAFISIFVGSYFWDTSFNLLILASVIIVISRISLHFLEILLHKLSIAKARFFLVFILDLVSLLTILFLFGDNIVPSIFSYSLALAVITILSVLYALTKASKNLS